MGGRWIAPRLKCDHCAEVIGVYEPVVVVTEDEIRETSRAAEPTIGSRSDRRYHRTCYLEHVELGSSNYGSRPGRR